MTTPHEASEIIDKAQQHLATLISRNWADISTRLEEDEEITISAKIAVKAREAESGTHADKDNSVKTTISFSKKFSDSTESALEDPNQPQLDLEPNDKFAEQASAENVNGLAEQAQEQPSEHHAEIGDTAKEFEQTKDVLTTAAQPIGTSLEQKLTEAAAGKTLPMVEVDFAAGYAPAHYVMKFGKKAKQQGWPEACIQLIRDVCEATADNDASVEAGVRVQQVLRAHSVPVPPKGSQQTPSAHSSLFPLAMQINSVSLDSQERFMIEFERAATAANWPEASVETIGNLIREETTVAGMHEVVKPYLAK